MKIIVLSENWMFVCVLKFEMLVYVVYECCVKRLKNYVWLNETLKLVIG